MPVISLPPKTAEARRKRCSRGLAHLQESSPEVRERWTGWDSGFCQDFLKHKPPMHASCRVTTWEPVTVEGEPHRQRSLSPQETLGAAACLTGLLRVMAFPLRSGTGPVGDLNRDWSPIHQRLQGCQDRGAPLRIPAQFLDGILAPMEKAAPGPAALGSSLRPFLQSPEWAARSSSPPSPSHKVN